MTTNEEHHIIHETDEIDEAAEHQEEELQATLDTATEHATDKKAEWDGPEKEEFHTEPGGEEPPPGSPEHDRGVISGP